MNNIDFHNIFGYSGDFWCDFTENQPFLGKWPLFQLLYLAIYAHARAARAGYLGEYRSDRSEIFRDDSLGYLQQLSLGDKGLVDFCQFP